MTAVSCRRLSGHGENRQVASPHWSTHPPSRRADQHECAANCVTVGISLWGISVRAQVHPIESFVRSSWRRQVVGFLTGAALPGGQR